MKELNLKYIKYRPVSKGSQVEKWEVNFNGEMNRIMYLVKSNIFHIYKLTGFCKESNCHSEQGHRDH